MKIAIFTDIYAPWGDGGIATSIKSQKDELEKLGHEVTVFCPGLHATEKGVVTVPSHKIIRLSKSVVALRPKKVERFVVRKFPNFEDFDVVHAHYEASCSIAGIRLAKRFKVPLVQTQHGREDMGIATNIGHPFQLMTATALNFAHKRCLSHVIKIRRDQYLAPTLTRAKMWELVVNHAENADVVLTPSRHFGLKIKHYGVTKPRLVVSNGISQELVDRDFKVRQMRDGDTLKMIWNSRVSKEKRIMPLLEALSILKRPYILHVYGDGNELKRAKKYAKTRRLNVEFHGAVDRQEIIKRMAESHLGVMMSYNFDVQPMTLLEAEATGLPVFICDPDMMEVVPEGGFIMADEPGAEKIVQVLEELKAEDIAKMSKIMMENRKKATQGEQIGDLIKAYEKAAERCGV